MKKIMFFIFCFVLLLSGCSDNRLYESYQEGYADGKEEGYDSGYDDGYADGKSSFQGYYDEELRPSYNLLAESYIFYGNNVCIIFDFDNTYHTYFGCPAFAEVDSYKLMFVEDASADGYRACSYCYEDFEYYPLPVYSEMME